MTHSVSQSSPSSSAKPAMYVGRFAPSPSGPLHFGSLVCALASYLDAKANSGKWLVRIEDIDPPREQPGADTLILSTLQKHGLIWDGEVLYQSTREEAYRQTLEQLQSRGLSYFCTCNRKRLNTLHGRYDGNCRHQAQIPDQAASIRLNTALALPASEQHVTIEDEIQGKISENFKHSGDMIIHRKDGLFAYQLAVSVDDIMQNITKVVRGNDLLDTTPKQALVMRLLGKTPPQYAHIPVVVNEENRKLSKQNHAPAIDPKLANNNLLLACKALKLNPPSNLSTIDETIRWAIDAWDIKRLKNQKQIYEADTRLV